MPCECSTNSACCPASPRAAIATAELIYFNKFGQPIWREPRGLAAGYAWPQLSIHRGRLQTILLDEVRRRLGRAAVRTGCHLAEFEDRGHEVLARFVSRKSGAAAASEAGDLLVGADGIHSCVRGRFFPDEGGPRYAGKMLWRATTEADPFLGGRSMIMAGHAAQKFVAYPICPEAAARGARSLTGSPSWPLRRRCRNGATGTAAAARPTSPGPSRRGGSIRWTFRHSSTGPRRSSSFPWSIATRWGAGASAASRCCGDAAHPMYPIGSNGASQAVLDAEALAASLAGASDVAAAPAAV